MQKVSVAMKNIVYPVESYQITGLCMNVHTYLGKGFLEIVYKDALESELLNAGIPYEREKEYLINYKGLILPHKFYADFVIYNKIILEIKAVKVLTDEHLAVTMNYLKVSKNKLGLLINFGEPSLVTKRVVL